MSEHRQQRIMLQWSSLVLFSLVFAIGFLVTITSGLTLLRGGELRSLNRIVEYQQQAGSLYNSPARDNRAYKLALIKSVLPDTVVVGSSRAMLFRDSMISGSFVNAGGTVANLAELISFLRAIEEIPDIRRVFVTLDFWWFDNDISSWSVPTTAYQPGRVAYSWGVDLMAPAFAFFDDGVFAGMRMLVRGAIGRLPFDAPGVVLATGFSARLNGTGYARDGSYYYGAALYCVPEGAQQRGWRVRRDALLRAAEFDDRRAWVGGVEALRDGLARLEARGVRVIPMMMPLAPSLHARLVVHPAFQAISGTLSRALPGLRDFHDPNLFAGLTDAGFIDAVHPGERVYAQVVERLLGRFYTDQAAAGGQPTPYWGDIDQVFPESGELGAAFETAHREGRLETRRTCPAR